MRRITEACSTRRRTLLRAAAVATCVFATYGSAAADEIHACITKTTGQLRVVSTTGQCKSNEAPLTWNVEGPVGPTGPQGPPGVDGQPGLVSAHQAEASGTPSGTPLGSFISGDLLTSMNLPAGNWAIFARVRISSDASTEYAATCSIRVASPPQTEDEIGTLETVPTSGLTNSKIVSMMAVTALTADGTVELRCNDSLTQPARWTHARIVAVQVTTIN
jgi:hypothetical protein